ncbi:MAG: type IV secretion system DNA-binding domain-containing protein [Silvibacterium sp.]
MPKLAKWGRTETIIWPPRSPIYTYGAVFLAFVATGLFLYLRFAFVLTPLQQFYLPYYLRTEMAGVIQATDKYQLLTVAWGGGAVRLAADSDVERGKTAIANGKFLPLQLTPAAHAKGAQALYLSASAVYGNKALHSYLKHYVFADRELFPIFRLPLLFGLLALAAQLPFSIHRDIRRRKEMKYGRRLRGPLLQSPREFSRTLQGDGIGIKVDGVKDMLRIPARAEAQHIQIIGDSGAGKTTIIYQILRQIQGRGDSAIVYDPAGEFVQRFYSRKRGDIILNPLDARCPYWGPSEELRRRSEAKAVSESLFQPTQDRKGEFFVETPQKIFAHLLTYGPSPQDLVNWMSNADEIDRRILGTEMAYMIAKGAQEQRNGVLASLGLVADSLRMLPTRSESKAMWTATEWAEERKGWVFITSQPTQRAALRPLHSLWIDLLVMRLLNEPKPEQRRVWFVLDELASLQRLPQLHTAITENRKSRNPLVLGFQGKAQLEYIYGHLAEVMLSQPATNIWLKTKEPKAGQWVSEFIGKVEIERMRETHFDGSRSGRNFTLDRQEEPLVMESEISGLEDLHAFMKHGNYVTRFSFPYLDVPSTEIQFDPRELPGERLNFDPKTLRKIDPVQPVAQPQNSSPATPAESLPGAQQPVEPQPLQNEKHGIGTTLTSY